MTGEIGNRCVTSVGNSWVVCNSKSRPGLKYYFNTFTGQAVWNLSPAEIEKATKYTKALPIEEIEGCPEPTDPPTDSLMDPSQTTSSQVYKEEIINRQLPNQIPSMFPVNLLNSIPGVSGVNPNVWNNQPNNGAMSTGPQVIYVAYQPPMNFQPPQEYPQYLPTHYQNNIVYDTQTEYSQNVHTNYQSKMFNRGTNMSNRVNRIHNNWSKNRFSQHVQQKQNWNVPNSDLRQKLTRKRSKSQSCEPDSYENAFCQDISSKTENIDDQMYTQKETASKYDLSALKQLLKPPNSKANNWFVVVDTEIILNNFPFLNKITDPDQNCYLLVPYHVVTELETLASCGSDVRIRRIYRFLTAQIDCELAFKGEDMTDIADNDTDKTFATCVDLAIQNNVILLSNDVKLYNYKNNNTNVHILTLNELKAMLQSKTYEQHTKSREKQTENKLPSRPITPTRKKSPTFDIKIVVSNDRELQINEKVPSSRFRSKTPDLITPNDVTTKENSIPSNSVPSSSKQAIDPGAQAGDSENYLDEVDHTPLINTPEVVGFEKRSENSYFCNSEKKKEIKLSRNSSCQKTNLDQVDTQIKKFRWRKQRRNLNTQMSVSKSSSVLSDQHEGMNHEAANLGSSCVKQDGNVNVTSPIFSTTPTRPPSEKSSISSHYKRIERPSIVIEETSTSGVISNTTLDCESVNSSDDKTKKTVSICEDVNFEMFQVAGLGMEEVLRTRREEWVLRFVQIMEDILREMLRDDSPFQSKDFATWATDLPELARCIIKKYSDHFNVVDAANRLSFTLQRISDSKGNVSANIEPGQYMDMYSFGVYLIDSLKSVNNDCEDLKTAEESLRKLLYDIQNANLDFSHNDNFGDELNESAARATEYMSPEKGLPQVFPDRDPITKTNEDDHSERHSSKNSYILRPRKQTPTKANSEPQQKTAKNVETTFFSSLELAKRLNTDNTSLVKGFDIQDTPVISTPNSDSITQTPPQVPPSPTTQKSSEKQLKVQATLIQETGVKNNQGTLNGNDNNETTGDNNENTGTTVETCFVRQFSSIAKFEERLLNKQFSDYDEVEEEYLGNSYDADTAFHDFGENELEDGEIPDLEDGDIADDTKEQNAPNIEEKWLSSEVDNNEKFRCFIKDFIGEIKESFDAVRKLCAEFVEEWKNSHESSPDMQSKLRVASGAMLKISNSLNSILDRESKRPEENIMLLLKKANLGDFVPDEELRKEYTDNISKCRDQAYACYKTVSLIMKGAGIRKVA